MRILRLFLIALILAFTGTAYCLERGPEDVLIEVVDVGPGLACVVVMPDEHYMIYDTGHWNTDNSVLRSVKELIPEGSYIELLVQSHSDSDHLGATDEICEAYHVRRILRTGMVRESGTWEDADNAIRDEVANDHAVDINLSKYEFPMGATYRFGHVLVTMVFGLGSPDPAWGELSAAEEHNAVSIVVRLVYDGKSVLFCGDTVGRHIGDPEDTCIAAEKDMVENAVAIPIDSDVIIAPHHGADNGSSKAFINAVSPDWVIFAAGHAFEHPRTATVERYLDAGVQLDHIFRTDLGDNEGGEEWPEGSAGEQDRSGDDTVQILLQKGAAEAVVEYRD